MSEFNFIGYALANKETNMLEASDDYVWLHPVESEAIADLATFLRPHLFKVVKVYTEDV